MKNKLRIDTKLIKLMDKLCHGGSNIETSCTKLIHKLSTALIGTNAKVRRPHNASNAICSEYYVDR